MSDDTYKRAALLIAGLSGSTPAPTVEPDKDGYLEICWEKGRKSFSIYLGREVDLFVGFYGKNDQLSGRYKGGISIPDYLHVFIDRVFV